MKITITPTDDIFKEGTIVCAKDNPKRAYIVCCIAQGYGDSQEGTFWAIDLFGYRVSGGNYRKDLFEKFSGTILIEA
jgi:hypothetical protein